MVHASAEVDIFDSRATPVYLYSIKKALANLDISPNPSLPPASGARSNGRVQTRRPHVDDAVINSFVVNSHWHRKICTFLVLVPVCIRISEYMDWRVPSGL